LITLITALSGVKHHNPNPSYCLQCH